MLAGIIGACPGELDSNLTRIRARLRELAA
jgi:hypothetical protein